MDWITYEQVITVIVVFILMQIISRFLLNEFLKKDTVIYLVIYVLLKKIFSELIAGNVYNITYFTTEHALQKIFSGHLTRLIV